MKAWNHPIRVLLTVVSVLFVAFIFINSMAPSTQSSEISGSVLEQVRALFRQLGISWEITDHMIRKTAHFLEYLGLGVLLFLTIRSHTPHPGRHLFTGLFLGLLVPVCDEFIQLFISGRSGQVSDIVLDFCGILTGALLFFLVFWLVTRKKRNATRWKHLAQS